MLAVYIMSAAVLVGLLVIGYIRSVSKTKKSTAAKVSFWAVFVLFWVLNFALFWL